MKARLHVLQLGLGGFNSFVFESLLQPKLRRIILLLAGTLCLVSGDVLTEVVHYRLF